MATGIVRKLRWQFRFGIGMILVQEGHVDTSSDHLRIQIDKRDV